MRVLKLEHQRWVALDLDLEVVDVRQMSIGGKIWHCSEIWGPRQKTGNIEDWRGLEVMG